jgi:aminoglycoside phosphotransferase (APT) family kinase protein
VAADLSGIVARLATDHCLSHCAAIGTGVESQVFAADSEQWGRVALKLPLRDSSYVSLNDPDATSERLFQQEHLLLNYLEKSGFPNAPRSFFYGDVSGLPYVILEYLDADPASRQAASELGRTLARLHRVPLPDLELSAQEAMPVPELIPARLTRRFAAYRRLSGSRAALPSAQVMAAALSDLGSPVSLLHLDMRSVNIVWSAPNGPKLLDWSNSVLGPPQLELARLAEIGDLVTDDVARGYRAEGGEVAGSPDSELIFRLDAAVMLALVFLSEGADPELVSGMVRRVDELAGVLAS